MKILILAAGVGSRLRPLTEFSPKPLLPLAGTSILERLLSQLRLSFGDVEIYVNCSYLAASITNFISTQPLDNRPKIIWEYEPLGTAVTTLNLFKSDPSRALLVIHGDLVLGNASIHGISKIIESKTKSFIMVHERPLNQARSIVNIQRTRVVGITEVSINQQEFSKDDTPVLVNSGILYFSPNSLSAIDTPVLGTDISPYLIKSVAQAGNLGFELWKWERVSVDSLTSYERAIRLVSSDPFPLN
jgi:NDP-sugar pyrophosphorylase family protein